MRIIAKVDGKGRVTIPLFIREILGIEPDSYVEIVVDERSKELKIKPIARSGEVLVDVSLELIDVNDIHKALNKIIEEGAEIKMLKCGLSKDRYVCTVTIGLISSDLVDALKKALISEGIKIISTSIVTKKVS